MASDQAFDMTADPDEFVEAVAEFSKRRIITRDEADKLEDYAKRRAWWISGVAQMDVVNDVHESILVALRKGTPFEEWQKQIGLKLEKAWGRKDSARILTIFRNATTQAYNAGRWQQMNEPHVAAARPFVEYDVVNDERTTEHICRPLVGVIVPLDSPFLRTHNPPLHHRCRTGLRTLRRRVAERKGITKDLPDVDATPGFGSPPDIAEPPKPSERETPPDSVLALENAVKAGKDLKKRKPVQVKIDPKHTPEYWEEHYREKYGDAAAQVGYGRAVHERAKAMDANEAYQIIDGLRDRFIPGVKQSFVDALDRDRKKRAGGLDQYDIESARILAQQFKLVGGNRVVPEMRASKELAELLPKNAKFWSVFSSPKLELPEDVRWEVIPRGGRACYHPGFKIIDIAKNDGAGVAIHEYGHAVEQRNMLNHVISKFLEARTSGEPLEKLQDLLPTWGYGESELTRKDKFYDPYVGKKIAATIGSEVLSTVVEDIGDGRIADILRNDPETLYFVLGLLAGT